jgi:amino acid adenylation domain-containing protein
MSNNIDNFNDIVDSYPLTMLQAGMLFHSEYNPDSAVYHDVFAYHLKGSYTLNGFKEAVEQLVLRHPILRTSFNLSDFSEPLQLVHRNARVQIEEIDLRYLSIDNHEKELNKFMEVERERKFDWKKAPLFRLFILRYTEDTFEIVVSFHHSILDGWSVASMITELFTLYLSNQGAINYAVDAMPKVSYRDYIKLERKALQSEEYKHYWLNKLEGSSFAKIPRWTLSKKGKGVAIEEEMISSEIFEDLNKMSRSLGIPLKNILLAGHLRVISLISDENDVVTGLVSNGRPEKTGSEKILGLFLNTLPFRLKIEDITWGELINQTFEAEQEMIPYRRYPLAQIKNDLRNKPLLFETMFNYTNFHVYKNVNADEQMLVSLGEKSFEQIDTPFLCHFSQDVFNNQLKLSINYDTSQFSRDQIKVVINHYINTLSAIKNISKKINETPIITEEEKHRILYKYNDTYLDYEKNKTVHKLFQNQVEIAPDKIALVYGGIRLSYRELNDKSNQLSRVLRQKGVMPDSIVGIMLERSADMVIAVMGVLKAGGAILPIDPGYPQERIRFMLEDSGARILLTGYKKELDGDPIQVIDVSDSKIYTGDTSNLENQNTPSDLLYIIYTSGTTGKPKAVMLEHRNMVNLVSFEYKKTNIDFGNRVMQFASSSFDVCYQEIFSTLLFGGELHIIGEDEKRDINKLFTFIRENDIKAIFLPTAYFKYITSDENYMKKFPDNVRHIITAGEQLKISNQFNEYLSRNDVYLHNHYGPSETHVVTTYTINKSSSSEIPPIGKPISNTKIYILDENKKIQPVGVSGELYISGDCVGRGYLNSAELTKVKFLTNEIDGERMYRTGDIARWLPDGNIEFCGRADDQVKVRGFRIELSEIECLLTQYENVKESVVIAREYDQGEKNLIAYIVLNENKTIVMHEIRQYLKDKLPNYMIPSSIVIMDAFPLTTNGKIDRRKLPEPSGERPEQQKDFVEPRTPTEKRLANIWTEVIKLDKVGIYDDFYELGGHSLLSLQVISRIREEFQIELPLQCLFDNPTIEQLALIIVQYQSAKGSDEDIEALLAEIEQLSDEEAKLN